MAFAPAHGLQLGWCSTIQDHSWGWCRTRFGVCHLGQQRVQDSWRCGWVPVPQTTSPLLDSYWFTLVTLPVVSGSRGGVSQACGGAESVHSSDIFPSLEIQQLWRKLDLEEQ